MITSLSPYLHGLLTSGLAESAAQSQELTLEDMDGRAVEAVVDCMYSGKLALSSGTGALVTWVCLREAGWGPLALPGAPASDRAGPLVAQRAGASGAPALRCDGRERAPIAAHRRRPWP